MALGTYVDTVFAMHLYQFLALVDVLVGLPLQGAYVTCGVTWVTAVLALAWYTGPGPSWHSRFLVVYHSFSRTRAWNVFQLACS